MVRPVRELLDGAAEVDETLVGGVKRDQRVGLGRPCARGDAEVHRVWLLGTHQGAVSHDQLDHYLDEFTFRFNRRQSRHRGLLFYRLLEGALATDPHPYKALISEPAA